MEKACAFRRDFKTTTKKPNLGKKPAFPGALWLKSHTAASNNFAIPLCGSGNRVWVRLTLLVAIVESVTGHTHTHMPYDHTHARTPAHTHAYMHTLCNLQQDVAYTCINRLCECVCVLTRECVCVRVRTCVASSLHVQLHTSVCARKCETPVYVFLH